MSRSEHAHAPGIGVLGEIKLSNYGTRAVKVVPDLLTPRVLNEEVGDPVFRTPGISRSVVKGITQHPLQVGELVLDHTAPFAVEAQIPFETADGSRLYWSVVGRNTLDRMTPPAVTDWQRQMIRTIARDDQYAPQSVEAMTDFVRGHNQGIRYGFTRVTPDNFASLEPGLRALYGAAFTDYPYDVVSAIGESCGDNLFVVAGDTDGNIYSATGAEYMKIGNRAVIAEIGDTASLPGIAGFGPLLKRVLFQAMADTGNVPDLVFTDSRLDSNGSVIKANRRAGLHLDPGIILPGHTTIASNRTQGTEILQQSSTGEYFPVENMTMTHLTRAGIHGVLTDYGNAY